MGHPDAVVAFGEQVIEEGLLELTAEHPLGVRVVPAVARVHDDGEGADAVKQVQDLGEAVRVVEGAGIAADAVDEKQSRVGERGEVAVAQAQRVVPVGVAAMGDEVRRVVEGLEALGGAPVGYAVVQPVHRVVREMRQERVEAVAALGPAAEGFGEEEGRVGVRVGSRLVGNGLSDELLGERHGVHGGAAQVDLGHEVHVAAAGAVVGLAPEGVAIEVPRAIEAGIVEVAGDAVVHIVAQGGGARHLAVDAAGGDDADVATEEHVLNAPVRVGVDDVVAELLGGVYARIAIDDVLDGLGLHAQALGGAVIEERLEGAEERGAGDEEIVVGALSRLRAAGGCRSAGLRGLLGQSLGVVHQRGHAGGIGLRAPKGRIRRGLAPLWRYVHGELDTRREEELSGLGGVLDREDADQRDVVTAHPLDRQQLGPLLGIGVVGVVDLGPGPIGGPGRGHAGRIGPERHRHAPELHRASHVQRSGRPRQAGLDPCDRAAQGQEHAREAEGQRRLAHAARPAAAGHGQARVVAGRAHLGALEVVGEGDRLLALRRRGSRARLRAQGQARQDVKEHPLRRKPPAQHARLLVSC